MLKTLSLINQTCKNLDTAVCHRHYIRTTEILKYVKNNLIKTSTLIKICWLISTNVTSEKVWESNLWKLREREKVSKLKPICFFSATRPTSSAPNEKRLSRCYSRICTTRYVLKADRALERPAKRPTQRPTKAQQNALQKDYF